MHFPCGEVQGNLKKSYKNNKFYLKETEIYDSFKKVISISKELSDEVSLWQIPLATGPDMVEATQQDMYISCFDVIWDFSFFLYLNNKRIKSWLNGYIALVF